MKYAHPLALSLLALFARFALACAANAPTGPTRASRASLAAGFDAGLPTAPFAKPGAEPEVDPAERAAQSRRCAQHTDCASCAPELECQWCGRTNRCISIRDHSCAHDAVNNSASCPGAACARQSNCADCSALTGCGWCGASNACMPGTANGPDAPAACASGWTNRCTNADQDAGGDGEQDGGPVCFGYGCQPAVDCARQTDCRSCGAITACGWCDIGHRCMPVGDFAQCARGAWAATGVECAALDCDTRTTCANCAGTHNCEWCGDTNTCIYRESGQCGGNLVSSSVFCPRPDGGATSCPPDMVFLSGAGGPRCACRLGTRWDEPSRRCVTDTCSGGTRWDPPTRTCVCPQGQQWSARSRACVANACPAGMVFDGASDRCLCAPAAPVWNASARRCEPCPGGQVWNGSACACPPGAPAWIANRCSACPGGQVWNGSGCVCTGGAVLTASGCACPSGQHWANNQCEICLGGTSWNGSGCVCPPGQVWGGSQCLYPAQPQQPPQVANNGNGGSLQSLGDCDAYLQSQGGRQSAGPQGFGANSSILEGCRQSYQQANRCLVYNVGIDRMQVGSDPRLPADAYCLMTPWWDTNIPSTIWACCLP